ncbi:ALBINO3-like protein 2, chloroplastic [Solanum stenotomum]|uniref:ALBINO3-like protein 2, chloroplastic n=1 Tax=Solanum stenotomum TaxID=172797 RepID=UPI0020D1B38B|nr:ALBINO3-like protein 2, chloroplastic [Solanum stenotomum]
MSIQRFFQHRRYSRNSPGIYFLHNFTSSDSHNKPSNPSDHYRHHNHGNSRYVHILNSFLPSKPQCVIPHSVSFCHSFSTRDSRIGDISDSAVTQYENTELFISENITDISDSAVTQYENTELFISENITESVEESILPVRALISLLDGYHDLTGFPWWIIIASSAVAMRLTLFPFVILQLHKLKRILELLPKLPPPLPPPMSRRSFRDQLKIFFKEKRAAGCPSFFWYFATLTVQVPCFFLWITTITRMSLYHHEGFDCGGILWFQNLTEFPSGVLGPVFPLLIAGLHYINIQVSFQKSSVEKMSGPVGLIAKYYQKYLGVLTLVILFITFNMPQGSLVFWLTNSSMTVIQQLSLKHPDVRKKLGLHQKDPQLEGAHPKELVNPGEIKIDPSKNQSKISVQNLSPQELVNLSIKHLAGGRKDEAMSFLRLAIAKDPKNVRALLIIGQTLLQDGSLPEATEYLERTIAKLLLKENQKEIEDVDLLILSSQWAGVACIRQGKMGEGLAHLERIATLKEPDDPKSKAHYYDGLVLLSSTLINAGHKKDAINYLQMATAYDESYREFLQQCENEEDVISNDLVTRRRRDY